MEVVVTTGVMTCKAPVTSSPSTNQNPTFYRPDALPVSQPTVSKHWREDQSSSVISTINKYTQTHLLPAIIQLTAPTIPLLTSLHLLQSHSTTQFYTSLPVNEKVNIWILATELLTRLLNSSNDNTDEQTNIQTRDAPITHWPIIGRPIIGAKQSADYLPITD